MRTLIRPPAIHLVDHRDASTWVPPGHEPIPTTPPDDRMDLVRAFVADDCPARGAARVLAQRAALGDREAWAAVVVDMTGPGRGHAWRVAEALGEGDLDTAVAEAARACGETVGEWLAWMRSERASAARTPEEASLRARLEAERARADKLARELASVCAERDGALAQAEELTLALRRAQKGGAR